MRAIFLFFFSLLFCSTVFSQSVGTKVSFVAADNKTYTGVVKETYGNYYKVRYDGYEFDAWLTADQFKVVSTSTNTTDYNSQSTTTNARSGLTAIFEFGKGNGWASQIIEQTFNNYVSALSATDQARLLNFIKKANTPSARFFVLKSFLAGDDFKLLQKFINELNQYPEYIQQEKCLVTMRKSIIQQWQQTCSVTTVQACLGDLSPRYTWEVKQIDNYDVIAPDPYKNIMGQQQKFLLEHYGGAVSKRGDASGKEIGILNALNELVGPLLRVRFYAQEATESVSSILSFIRGQIDNGLPVPLLINFEGNTGGHFIVVMRYKWGGGENEYLIYDPWVGMCDYVSESTLLRGSLSPLNTTHRIRISYYYPTVSLTAEELQNLIKTRNQKNF